MIDINKIIRYFALHYPYKNELSKTRMTKMVYLADWFYAKKNNKQLTKIRWYFDHYGPFVSDVYAAAQKDNKITFVNDYSAYGTPKLIFGLKDYQSSSLGLDELSRKETEILDQVIEETKALNWSEFIDYVYATYPIKSQKRYDYLNLEELAKEMKNQ